SFEMQTLIRCRNWHSPANEYRPFPSNSLKSADQNRMLCLSGFAVKTTGCLVLYTEHQGPSQPFRWVSRRLYSHQKWFQKIRSSHSNGVTNLFWRLHYRLSCHRSHLTSPGNTRGSAHEELVPDIPLALI